MSDIKYTTSLDISLDSYDDYYLLFRRDTDVVAEYKIPARKIPEGGLRVDTVNIPDKASGEGFDNVLIVPKGGDKTYSVGHLKLHERPLPEH